MGRVLVGVISAGVNSAVGVGVSFPVNGTGSCVSVKNAADVLVGSGVFVAMGKAVGMNVLVTTTSVLIGVLVLVGTVVFVQSASEFL